MLKLSEESVAMKGTTTMVEEEVVAWMEVCQASMLSATVRLVEMVEEPQARQEIASEAWTAWTDIVIQFHLQHVSSMEEALGSDSRRALKEHGLHVEDGVAERVAEVASLEEQQGRLASQIRSLQESCDTLEHQQETTRQDVEKKTVALQELDALLEERKAALAAVEAEIQTRTHDSAALGERLEQLEEQQQHVLETVAHHEEEKQQQEELLKDVTVRLRTAETQLVHIDGEVERKHEMVASLQEQIQTLEGILTDDMPEKKNRALAALEAAMTEQQEKLSVVEVAVSQKEEELQVLRTAFEELDQAFNEKELVQRHALEEATAALAQEQSHLDATRAEVEEQKSTLQRLESLVMELESKQASLNELLPRKMRSLEELEEKLASKRRQVASAEAEIDDKRREIATQRTELAEVSKQVRSYSTARESMERDHQEEDLHLRDQKEELMCIETELEKKKHLIASFEEKLAHLGTQIHAKHELISRQERQEQQFKNYVSEQEVAFKEICEDLRNKSKQANEIQLKMDSMTLELSQLENAVMQKRSTLDELQLTHNSFQDIIQVEKERKELLTAECRKLDGERARLEQAIENYQRSVSIQEQLLRSLKENVELWSNQKKMRTDLDETAGGPAAQRAPVSHSRPVEVRGRHDVGNEWEEEEEKEEEEDQWEKEEVPRQRHGQRQPPSKAEKRPYAAGSRRSVKIPLEQEEEEFQEALLEEEEEDFEEEEQVIREGRRSSRGGRGPDHPYHSSYNPPHAHSHPPHSAGYHYQTQSRYPPGPLYQRILPDPPVNSVTASLIAVQQRAQRLRESSMSGTVNTPRTPRHAASTRAAAGMVNSPSLARDLYRQYVSVPQRHAAANVGASTSSTAEGVAEGTNGGHSPVPVAPMSGGGIAVRGEEHTAMVSAVLANGLGSVGGSGGPAEKLREELRRIRQLTAMQQVATLAQQASQA